MERVCPIVLCFTLLFTNLSFGAANDSIRNNIQNRKRIVEKRSIKDSENDPKPTNALKEALLNAIQSSSNEDFDVLDVLYVVAKTYKDKQYFDSDEFDNTKKTQRLKKSKTIRRKRSKRKLYDYKENISHQSFSNSTNDERLKKRSTDSDNSFLNSYNDIFARSKAQPKRANLFNVPVDDMFLGTFAIPTNQAVAELALKQLEWFAFIFVNHIFDTNAAGDEEGREEGPNATLLG